MTKHPTLDEQEVAIKKLPQWVQRKIEKLEADVKYWEDNATAGPKDSDTFLSMGIGQGKPLGHKVEIDFHFSGHVRDRISVRKQGDSLYISGWGPVVIQPHASNCFYVELAQL